ncbi:type I-E CRISPR-associated protein Cas5/CasD, partial [Escherichia coli]
MRSYLILRLAGPMQAWGQPTFEGTRPTGRFPTRSGLLGLLGACLGIQRDDTSSLQALSESVQFAVRCDELILDDRRVSVTGLRDYHTVLGAREDYRGLKSHETIH